MKTLKFYFTFLSVLLCISAFAQVQINKQIQLIGAGTDAKLTGIQSVTNTQDATSAGALQSGSLIYAIAGGANDSFSITISPPINAYQAGMVFNFISNQNITGPSTLNVNGFGAKTIKKNFNLDFSGCEILNGQFVTVGYDGANFQMTSAQHLGGTPPTIANAGPDQLNQLGFFVTLAADTPTSGTGLWTIVSGTGGSFSDSASPASMFSGVAGNSYVLNWAISTSNCGSNSSNVNISFSQSQTQSQTFSYTGGQQTFVVPALVTQLSVFVYGAQGGTVTTNIGGLGGYSNGTLNVTPAETLNIYVGGQPSGPGGGFNGGGNGVNNGTGGGGASDIRVGGTDLGSRVIVAGGGGGTEPNWASTGGSGGGTDGGDGTSSVGGSYIGHGGTQSSGGSNTYDCPVDPNGGLAATLGQGGTPGDCEPTGAGGGGGYYGGGAGDAGGGGGGSGYTGGVGGGSTQNGVQSGNGQVIITW